MKLVSAVKQLHVMSRRRSLATVSFAAGSQTGQLAVTDPPGVLRLRVSARARARGEKALPKGPESRPHPGKQMGSKAGLFVL